jgi:hypothetical protein
MPDGESLILGGQKAIYIGYATQALIGLVLGDKNNYVAKQSAEPS